MTRVLAALAAVLLLLCAAPARAVPPIEDYGKLPAIEQAQLSPSGERLAFIAVVGERRKLFVRTVAGEPIAAADVGDTKVRAIHWGGEDYLFVVVSTTADAGFGRSGDYEALEVVVLNVRTRKVFGVFGHETDRTFRMVMGDYGAAEVGGRWYGYFAGITVDTDHIGRIPINTGYLDLYQVDLETGDAKIVSKGDVWDHDWVLGVDGSVLAHTEYDHRTGDWRLVRGEKIRKPVVRQLTTPMNDIVLRGQGRTAGTALVEDRSGDEDAVLEIPLGGGEPAAVVRGLSVGNFFFDPDTRLLQGVQLEDDARTMALFDPLLKARFEAARKAFPGKMVRLASAGRGFARMVVLTEGGGDSGTLWLVDVDKARAEPLGDAHPTIRTPDVGVSRLVDYKAADGLAMNGVLTLPPGREAKNLPLVVLVHGGPAERDHVGFSWWAQALASRGYAVFQPNFRGSDSGGGAFRRAGFGEWGRKMQSDITDGAAALAAQGIVDPKRACIVGGSYGGYAALAGVTLQHGLYKCAVSVSGIADIEALLQQVTSNSSVTSDVGRYWRAQFGVKGLGDPLLQKYSPIDHVAEADAPILLIHGKDDTVVPLSQSIAMQKALKKAGKTVEFVPLEGEDHWLSREKTRIAMLKALDAFVERYNPPDQAAGVTATSSGSAALGLPHIDQ